MRRGSSNTTPIYFFTSVSSGSGKSSIVSNLAVYLTDLEYKVALLDFDNSAPDKLVNAFPENYEMEQYNELSTIITSEDARFTQNFYFTDTKLLSYFPAKAIEEPSLLMTDTALRDFFLQLINAFNIVLINLPPGTSMSRKVSDLISRNYLWHGCNPASVIVSTSEETSLVKLDALIQQNQIISYQAEENTYFLFNKVLNSADQQNPNENVLTMQEVRRLFAYPLTFIIPQNEEFAQKQNNANAFVLKNDTLTRDHISSLFRLLTGSVSLSQLLKEANNYQSCISGNLLSRIYPYLEQLQQRVAAKLFINPADVQLFLEQNDQNFRIRIRLTSIGQKLMGIRSDIPEYKPLRKNLNECPEHFEAKSPRDSFTTVSNLDRDTNYALSFKSIFTFDDSFYSNPITVIAKHIEIVPNKDRFPSPILFAPKHTIAEIPTLTNILGLQHQQKYCEFTTKEDEIINHGVTPFLIPPDFHLCFALDANFQTAYTCEQNFIEADPGIIHQLNLPLISDFIFRPLEGYTIYDIFARNKGFEFTTDFGLRGNTFSYISNGILALPAGEFSLFDDKPDKKLDCLIEPKESVSPIADITISKLSLEEPRYTIVPAFTVWEERKPLPTIKSPEAYCQSEFVIAKPEFKATVPDTRRMAFSLPQFKIGRALHNRKVESSRKTDITSGIVRTKSPDNYGLFFSSDLLRIHYRDKVFRSLPDAFKIHVTMMDYRYSPLKPKEERQILRCNETRVKTREYKPDFNLRFKHKYMEPDLLIRRKRATYVRPIMYQLFVTRLLAIENSVSLVNTEYKVGYNEIFPVIYFPQARHTYQYRSFKPIEWLGEKGRDPFTKLYKLSISPIKTERQNGEYEQLNLDRKYRYSKSMEINMPEYPVNLLVSAPEKPEFLRDYLKYPTMPLLGAEPMAKMEFEDTTILKTSDYKNIIESVDTEIDAPNIFTERMRFRKEGFTSFNWQPLKAQITQGGDIEIQRTALKMSTFVHHNYRKVGELRTRIEQKTPVLMKASKLINNFTDLHKERESLEFTLPFNGIETERLYIYQGICNRHENTFVEKQPDFSCSKPKLCPRYILQKVAIKVPKPKLGRTEFFIVPETPSEALYKHLLWQYSNASGPTECEYNEKLKRVESNSRFDEFNVLYDYTPTPVTIEFLVHDDITKKLNRFIPRRPYKIKTNYLADLLALAKEKSRTSLATIANLGQ